MTRYFTMHPENPQPRLIKEAVLMLEEGKILAYPTDSCYALGCTLESKQALDTIRKIRHLDEKHPLTLLCHDIAEASIYCQIDNPAFRLLKQALSPSVIEITDESHLHLGHEGAKTGASHFSLVIVSTHFNSLSGVERHQLIYQYLHDLIPLEIHALKIKAYTPLEYHNK